MLYEVFDCRSGATVGVYHGERTAKDLAERYGGGYDMEPAEKGFYIKRYRGEKTDYFPRRFTTATEARAKADMHNMSDDFSTYTVVEQK